MPDMNEPESPCIKVCAIDPEDRVCMGCYRSLQEIAAWPRLTVIEKRDLLVTLQERRQNLGSYHYNAGNRRR